MAKGSASPRSQQRLRVFDAYRGRGKRTNPLWLVYSVKTDQDLILSSDRRFVHWLVFLEANPSVKSFHYVISPDGSVLDTSIQVHLTNGAREIHLVQAGDITFDVHSAEMGGETGSEVVKIFTDAELKPHVLLAMRWHKALAFAAAIRYKESAAVRLALVPLVRSLGSGTLGQISKEMRGFEEATTFGVLVRLAVEGHVSIDLTASGFGHATRWHWQEGDKRVVT